MGGYIQIDDVIIYDEYPRKYTTILNAANHYSFKYYNTTISLLQIKQIFIDIYSEVHIFFRSGNYRSVFTGNGCKFLTNNQFLYYWKTHKNHDFLAPQSFCTQVKIYDTDALYIANYKDKTFIKTTKREPIPQAKIHPWIGDDLFNAINHIISIKHLTKHKVELHYLDFSDQPHKTILKYEDPNIIFATLYYYHPEKMIHYNRPLTTSLFELASKKIKEHSYEYYYNKHIKKYCIHQNDCDDCHQQIIDTLIGKDADYKFGPCTCFKVPTPSRSSIKRLLSGEILSDTDKPIKMILFDSSLFTPSKSP